MPPPLNADERRVFGVLLEKSYATPEQYPLTLNALVVGSNQKSCRDPMTSLGEEQVLDALDSLRQKGLVMIVRSEGGRTDRFRHRARDTLQLEGREAAIVAELLLRGPQTDGELRQRASRLVPIPGLDELAQALAQLLERPDPLVRRLSPAERRRGAKYAHTFYPPGKEPALEEGGPEDEDAGEESPAERRGDAPPRARSGEALESLARAVARLEERVDALEAQLLDLRRGAT